MYMDFTWMSHREVEDGQHKGEGLRAERHKVADGQNANGRGYVAIFRAISLVGTPCRRCRRRIVPSCFSTLRAFVLSCILPCCAFSALCMRAICSTVCSNSASVTNQAHCARNRDMSQTRYV
eukprot:TRINITY_DN5356_c0_g1_i10.p1 TRINITY_DN5356_c0_g1~~TRINITY_DN5356_c0_g1_i10.p1  ORF type:complete len:122 (-),score=2.96 TRINITY_DN5356_c0_g1_i10:184-549(-)